MKTDHVEILNRIVRISDSANAATYLVRAVNFQNPNGASAWLEQCNKFGRGIGGQLVVEFLSELYFE